MGKFMSTFAGQLSLARLRGLLLEFRTSKQMRLTVLSMGLRGATMVLGFFNNLMLARWLSPSLLGSSASVTGLMAFHGLFTTLNQDNELIRRLRPVNPSISYMLRKVHAFRMLRSIIAAGVLISIMGFWAKLSGVQMISGFIMLTALNCTPWWILGVRGDYTPQYVLMFFQSMLTFGLFATGQHFFPNAPAGSDLTVYAIAYVFANLGIAVILARMNQGKADEPISTQRLVMDKSLLVMGIIITIYSGSDVLLASRLCSNHDAGIYRVAATIVSAVNSLWLVAQANVYPQLVHGKEGVPEWTSTRGLRVWIVGALGLGFAASALALIVRLILGARYDGIVGIAAILGLAKTIGFIDAFWGLRMNAAGMNKEVLKVVAVCGATGVFSSFLLCHFQGPIGLACGFLLAEMMMLTGIFSLRGRLYTKAMHWKLENELSANMAVHPAK